MKNYFKIFASIIFSILTLNANAQSLSTTNTRTGVAAGYHLEFTNNPVDNSFFGFNAGYSAISSSYNTFIGANSGYTFLTGADNVAVGNSAGGTTLTPGSTGLEIGENNVLIGSHTFDKMTPTSNTSNDNVVLGGYNFYKSNITSNGNVAIGSYAVSNYVAPSKSFFILNNQAQRSNPLLFGYFAPNTDRTSSTSPIANLLGSQLAINTTGLKPGFSLSINGPTFIGSFTNTGANNTTIASGKLENYKLWVEKGVISEDFAVASVNSWADFVFEKDYKLKPLSEVEEFINKNKHLPDVPSAAALKENGASMIEIMKNLTQKVEELTLYAIQQDKQIKALQTQLTATKESKNK
ncbi:MAG: hypothetical protein EOO43_19910 [Flavobacterium sp.]|nr:MAG: hypothetical protein EOO43_19910 [Flavobacterium sp.]